MTGLKWLYLNNNQIGNKGCKHLSLALVKMEKMTVFHLENNQIGDEGCESFGSSFASNDGVETTLVAK